MKLNSQKYERRCIRLKDEVYCLVRLKKKDVELATLPKRVICKRVNFHAGPAKKIASMN